MTILKRYVCLITSFSKDHVLPVEVTHDASVELFSISAIRFEQMFHITMTAEAISYITRVLFNGDNHGNTIKPAIFFDTIECLLKRKCPMRSFSVLKLVDHLHLF